MVEMPDELYKVTVNQSTLIFERQNDGESILGDKSHVKKLIDLLNCSSSVSPE